MRNSGAAKGMWTAVAAPEKLTDVCGRGTIPVGADLDRDSEAIFGQAPPPPVPFMRRGQQAKRANLSIKRAVASFRRSLTERSIALFESSDVIMSQN